MGKVVFFILKLVINLVISIALFPLRLLISKISGNKFRFYVNIFDFFDTGTYRDDHSYDFGCDSLCDSGKITK